VFLREIDSLMKVRDINLYVMNLSKNLETRKIELQFTISKIRPLKDIILKQIPYSIILSRILNLLFYLF